MAIICYTGLPGDGKSYSAVENVVIPALRSGRVVAHNLQLNATALAVVCERDVSPLLVQIGADDTPAQVVERCPPGAVVVLDEVWRYWPAGLKANEVPKDELRFFKEHRHRCGADGLATEVLIIDQDPKTGIPAFLRALVELTYVHTKHGKLGAKNRFRVDVYTRAQSAQSPQKSALLRSLHGSYKPQVWNCYVSHTQAVRIGEAGLEKAVDQRANLWRGWTLRSAVVAVLLLPFLIWLAWRSVNHLAGSDAQKRDEGALEHPAPASAPVSPSAPALSKEPAAPTTPASLSASSSWRYAGFIGTPRRRLYVVDGDRGSRLVPQSDCDADRVGNVRCRVDGAEVALWTGPPPPTADTFLRATAPVAGSEP